MNIEINIKLLQLHGLEDIIYANVSSLQNKNELLVIGVTIVETQEIISSLPDSLKVVDLSAVCTL